jgi:hypothetical protein
MSAFIRVKNGNYRGKPVVGMVFQMVEQMKTGASGSFVTVKNGGAFPGFPDVIRVRVNAFTDYEFVDAAEHGVVVDSPEAAEAVSVETDEEAMSRIREKFDILENMTKACVAGDIRAMIVSGPPGVGKSHGVEEEVEKATLFDKISGKRLRAEVVKGSTTAIGLYQLLYKYSDSNCLVVFDDADEIFFDSVSLNLLKGALDSGKKRRISWLAESSALRREGIPESFEFKGSIIFLTNLSFSNVRSKVLKDHLEALQSRCHFVDLSLHSLRDKILRIKQIISDGMLENYGLDMKASTDIVSFIEENQTSLREVSLRTAIKAADLRKAFPEKWKSYAKMSLLKEV